MHKWILGFLLAVLLPFPALAAGNELYGTYRLVSSQRRILDTGQVVDSYGKDPKGFIMYGRDGRFLGLITNGGRPKAPSIEKITSEQREELFRTMVAYGGTYTFDGKKVEHHIDISWNEVWSGTTTIRDVTKEGDRLILTTSPGPFALDGKMSVNTLVWEKVK
jgi:hypothetical protein